jgi:hypothetical protein
MNKNSRLFWTIATIAIVVLCLGVTVVTGIVINNSIKATAIAYEEPVVDEVEEPVADEVEEPVADEVEEPVADEPEPTYWSNYSCSDLGSCTIAVAPAGGFTIGFTREKPGTCSWKIFETGENISYQGIHEIHSYKGTLPLTSLDGFVESQFQFVDACTN